VLLSIIILNYKSWDKLEDCIKSILNYPPKDDYEIIVVDNDSQDGVFESFQSKFPSVKLFKNKGNYGFSSGNNFGADKASGEYFLFLNPDTELTKSPAIDRMIEYMAAHKNSGIVSCRKLKPNGNYDREITFLNPWLSVGIVRSLYKIVFKSRIQKQYPDRENIWHPDWLTGSVFLISKKTFDQVKGLSEHDFWMYFEELDLAKKIRKINKTVTLLRDVEIIHQHGGSSRKNPATSAITKSEVLISRHVYIQKYFSGLNLICLHSFMFITSYFSQLILAIIYTPFFWTRSSQAKILLLFESSKYYYSVLKRLTFKSKRLKKI